MRNQDSAVVWNLVYDKIDQQGPLQPNGRALFSVPFREHEYAKINFSDASKELPYTYSWALGTHEALGLKIRRRSLREVIDGDEPWIYPLAPVGALKHWLFADDVNTLFRHCDRETIDALAHKNGFVLIDYSYEGNGFELSANHVFQRLHFIADTYRIPANKIIFLFGNLLSDRLYQKWADQHNIETKINVVPVNLFEVVQYFQFKKEAVTIAPLAERDKLYLCLNRQQHSHRIALGMRLNSDGLLPKSFYSFQAQGFHVASFGHELEVSFGRDFYAKNQKKCEEFISILPLTVDAEDMNDNPAFKEFDNKFYQRSRCSLVTETTFLGENLFLSEKTYKPIQNKHPFMLLGHAYSLAYLKSLDYQSFAPVFDESYDLIEDDTQRLEAFCNEVARVGAFNEVQWQESWPALVEKVDYNFALFNQRGKGHVDRFCKRLNGVVKAAL